MLHTEIFKIPSIVRWGTESDAETEPTRTKTTALLFYILATFLDTHNTSEVVRHGFFGHPATSPYNIVWRMNER